MKEKKENMNKYVPRQNNKLNITWIIIVFILIIISSFFYITKIRNLIYKNIYIVILQSLANKQQLN